MRRRSACVSCLVAALLATRAPLRAAAAGPTTLLTACDEGLAPALQEIGAAYAAHLRKTGGEALGVREACGPSAHQARAVLEGLEADTVAFAQSREIDTLARQSALLPRDWARRLPDHAAPTATVIVFLVRKGNPKGIHDWPDLVRTGIVVPTPDPKLTSDGRLVYYAAWGGMLHGGGTAGQARALVVRLFRNARVSGGDAHAAALAFAQADRGDALVVQEQQVSALRAEFGRDLEVVVPAHTLLVEHPVAVVAAIADRRGTRAAADAWLQFLWSDEAQQIAARHGLRPRNAKVLAAHRKEFPPTDTFTLDDQFGGWEAAQQAHFGDGGIYDQIQIGVRHD